MFTPSPHNQAIQEEKELARKIEKLGNYIYNEFSGFQLLERYDQELLLTQYEFMGKTRRVLQLRLDRFEHAEPVFDMVLWWNKYANATYEANTYRIAAFGLENICDASHWMPLPSPPESKDLDIEIGVTSNNSDIKPNAAELIRATVMKK